MATARVRTYVRENAEKVEQWRVKLLKTYFINMIASSNIEGMVLPDVHQNLTLYSFTGNQGQTKICKDVLYEHFELINGASRFTTQYGGVIDYIRVDLSAALEAIKDIGIKPTLKVYSIKDVIESDVYTHLNNMSLANIAYVYHNQEEYAYIKMLDKDSSYVHNDPLKVGILDLGMKDKADNIAFRNAIAAHYKDNTPLTASVVCGLDLPHLSKPTTDYNPISHETYEFTGYINSCLIPQVGDLTEKRVAWVKERVQHGIDYLTAMLEEYSQLEGSILDAEASVDGGFQELFYQKTIGSFYQNLPLLINSEDKDLKSLAARAAKKKYT